MSNEKIVHVVNGNGPYHAAQHVAQGKLAMMSYPERITGKNKYRVTVERIEPEPEMKWWHCRWQPHGGFDTREIPQISNSSHVRIQWADGEYEFISATIHSATEPTLTEFAAAVKDATGVEIPVPEEEQPQWHYFNPYGWKQSHPNPFRAHVFFDAYDNSGHVWGTTADRDAKRDALLEAARKAGKQP